MATLSKANMVTGNTITAADVTQLVDALTAGGGYSVSISGSLTGSATNASKLDPTLNASTNLNYNVLFASTSSATYETIYKENGTVMTYNPSTDVLTVTSSFATTASYALNATNPTVLYDQNYERLGSGIIQGNIEFIAGAVQMSSGTGISGNFPNIVGKTLNVDLFITTTVHTTGVYAVVTGIGGAGAISFSTTGGGGGDIVNFTGIVIL